MLRLTPLAANMADNARLAIGHAAAVCGFLRVNAKKDVPSMSTP
eukprot:CAMPEP_0179102416 /NCGR_PEP_ID=MMETSP0796-20121207/47401_1 /TAXON_ID=73915 /ORGANISM="Pyrodinium bahamense, Strain pbaha01" /LENGTH=43 /DNA_ID= /DNA_START= /DNA_END= /DNA_ORIENTATION=